MSFSTFCLSCSQLFAKGRFTGLSSVWRPLTCHSYWVGALHISNKPAKDTKTKECVEPGSIKTLANKV